LARWRGSGHRWPLARRAWTRSPAEPEPLEKLRRFGMRFWQLAPKSFRAVAKLEAQIIVWVAVLFGLLFVIALVARLIRY
jgi:hypothetical protein